MTRYIFMELLKKLKIKHLVASLFVTFFLWMSYDFFATSNLNETQIKNLRKSNTEKINLNEVFHIGRCLLVEAGKKIVKIRNEKNLDLSHKEKDNSILTKADIESHNILVHTLKSKYKKLDIKSEESDSKNFSIEQADTSYLIETCDNYEHTPIDKWENIDNVNIYIDPLDATQEYSENLVDYVTVMLCITVNGTPKAGIIHKPFNSTTISSFFESKKLKKSNRDNKKTRVIVSRSHTGSVKSIIDKKFNDAEIIVAGGAGFKTWSLIKNQADLYLHTTKIYKWDICAPNAILDNLGGSLRKLNGEKINYSTHKNLKNFGNQEEEDNTEIYDAVDGGIIAALYNYDYFLNVLKNKV